MPEIINAKHVGVSVVVDAFDDVVLTSGDVDGPASSVDDRLASFDGITGKVIQDSGVLATAVVVGPATAVDDRIATFNTTTGKLIQDGGYTIAELGAVPVTINTQTGTTYPLVLADAGKLVTLSNGSPITLTVPLNSTAAFPVGTVIACAQIGAGLVTIEGAAGVTINGVDPGAEASAGQWSTWSLTKLATDTWLASGGLA